MRQTIILTILALLISALGIRLVEADDPPQKPGFGIERDAYVNFDIRRGQVKELSRPYTGMSLFYPGRALQGPRSGSAQAIARAFLNNQNGRPGILRNVQSSPDLVLEQEFQIGNSGLTHLVFRQNYNGIPVFGGHVQVHVLEDGSVLRANLPALVRSPRTGVSRNLTAGSATPGISRSITSAEALRAAEDALGISASTVFSVGPTIQGSGASNGKATDDFLKSILSPEQVYFPLNDRSELAWELFLPDLGAGKMFHVVVSAEDGRLLFSRNLAVEERPEGTVFRAPRSSSNSDAGVPDPDAGARTVVTFTGYPASDGDCPAPIYSDGSDCWATFIGDPVNEFFTIGNNVFSGEDFDDDGTVSTECSNPDGHLNFPFTNSWEDSGDIFGDSCATITNLFYWTNVAHDWFYELGFDEQSGNFQIDNFSRGGLENDRVLAVVGGDTNNAFFATFPDGTSPIMFMGKFNSPRRADSALDPVVIIHEYGHGVTTRMVGGASNVDALPGLQSGAMGEGWSDAFAFSLMDDPVVGEYVTGNSTNGIRRHPYNNSPWTYGDFAANYLYSGT